MILSRRAGIIWLGSAIVLLALLMPLALKAQNAVPIPTVGSTNPPAPSTAVTNDPLANSAAPSLNPSAQPSGAPQANLSTNPASSTNSPAALAMTAEMQKLKDGGKLTSNRAVAAAVRKVITDNSIQHDIPAPMGAKVIAVHKHPGDLVHIGDKIVTLFVNGKELPILAKQEGIMQTINVSKGGIIGNSRPRAVKADGMGSILLTLRPLRSPAKA